MGNSNTCNWSSDGKSSNQGPQRPPSINFYIYERPPRNLLNTYNDDTPPSYFGFIANVKFRSTLACTRNETSTYSLTDSVLTHHFFYNHSFFKTHESMKDVLQTASGDLTNILCGSVVLPIDGGVNFESYQMARPSSNIISMSKISFLYDILFTEDYSGHENTSFWVMKNGKQTRWFWLSPNQTDFTSSTFPVLTQRVLFYTNRIQPMWDVQHAQILWCPSTDV